MKFNKKLFLNEPKVVEPSEDSRTVLTLLCTRIKTHLG